MMRVGVFSDIHGNIYALEKTWKALKAECCDMYFFLGDICGYYYCQNEVIEMLREMRNLAAVRGNHDDIFLRTMSDAQARRLYTEKYGRSIELLTENIKIENLDFLRNLPESLEIQQNDCRLLHGSPKDLLNGYVYPDSSLDGFGDVSCKVLFLGHTHYPMDRTMNGVRFINPGSCGQPRDYCQASYAVFDFNSGLLRFERIEYDRVSLIKDVIERGESNSYLVDVLKKEKS